MERIISILLITSIFAVSSFSKEIADVNQVDHLSMASLMIYDGRHDAAKE